MIQAILRILELFDKRNLIKLKQIFGLYTIDDEESLKTIFEFPRSLSRKKIKFMFRFVRKFLALKNIYEKWRGKVFFKIHPVKFPDSKKKPGKISRKKFLDFETRDLIYFNRNWFRKEPIISNEELGLMKGILWKKCF